MLHKVPYIRIPDKLGGSSLDLNPYLKQLPFNEQVRVKRMTFYYGMFIDDGKNKSSSLCAYPCFNHGAYYKGKFIYVYIDKRATNSNCCDLPLIPTVSPRVNAQASNLNWTDFIDEFIN